MIETEEQKEPELPGQDYQARLALQKGRTERAMDKLLKNFSLEEASPVILEMQDMLSSDYLESKGFHPIGKNNFHVPESKYVDEFFVKKQKEYRRPAASELR